ncbi:hypothetical protein RvY_15294 [Ramazzottius varieornatus]|uniref:EGF-like domain-containing protein n=1 Tax=Ramazzottius varieornatus TaxID=947166 RepID=A0A1D1VZ52_RAMVA|nr:hypothetical protein RvY_15294 [Ramazzottius varieornatus]
MQETMGASLCVVILILCVSACSLTEPLQDAVISRQERSIEGQPCNADNNFNCSLCNTICNRRTGVCECDRRLAVPMKMPLFPEVTQCIPYEYVNVTGGMCLPTNPDMCTLLVSGSYCDVSQRDGTVGRMRCRCKIAGTFPNCVVRIGTACRQNSTCEKDVANSFCGNITNGIGRCQCGQVEGGRKYISNRDGTACLAINCATNPCSGDQASSTCRDTAYGYECSCNPNTKGKSHTFDSPGICCPADQVACEDFTKCLNVTDICNGVADCQDCSDEKQIFCTGPLPKTNPTCLQIPSTQNSLRSSSNIGCTSVPAATTAQEASAPTSTNTVNQVGPASAPVTTVLQEAQPASNGNGFPAVTIPDPAQFLPGAYNALRGVSSGVPVPAGSPQPQASVIRTNVPTLAIPALGLQQRSQG